MKKQDKINKVNEINAKYSQNYQFNDSGRIFTMFMGKKQWHKFDELVERWERFEKERNADANVKATCLFIEENGGKCTYKSMYGAKYYDFKGYKVRISNHHWTSDNHLDPDVNLCSYEVNGHIEMINKLKSL